MIFCEVKVVHGRERETESMHVSLTGEKKCFANVCKNKSHSLAALLWEVLLFVFWNVGLWTRIEKDLI